MLLMELHDEFARTLPLIEQQNFSLKQPYTPPGRKALIPYAPFFETVIRYLGGLLSAYALSHEPILLERADDLATKLAGAFDTPTGFPAYGVNTETCVELSIRIYEWNISLNGLHPVVIHMQ